jgi:amino acid transporter
MTDVEVAGPATSSTGLQTEYSRNATGLVREVKLLDQILFNAASTSPLGAALVVNLFALVVFPRSNLVVTLLIAIALGLFVWTTFALMSAMMPRVGGDFTYNARVLHPALALGANLCEFLSAALSTGFWGYWVATQGLSPVFTVIGGVTGSDTLTRWGNDFTADHHTAVFIVAALSVVLVSVLSAMGTRVVMRTMSIMVLIAAAGYFLSMFILLLHSPGHFQSTIDSFAGSGAYDKTVQAGAGDGLYPSHGGYSVENTFGSLFFALSATVWIWWGTYMSSEFRGGGRRNRQMKAIAGTGVVQGLLIWIGLVILLHVVGHDFLVSALNGHFSGPGGGAAGTGSYAYFAAIAAGSAFLTVVLALAFLGWWLPGVYINIAMPQRALLTWAFDNLLPSRLAAVSRRTHTPVVAIGLMTVIGIAGAAWTAYSSSFFEVYAILILFAFMPVLLTGISAFLIRWRRPDLYRNSAADWRLGGIEVLPVAGAGCAFVAALAIFLIIHFRDQLLPQHFTIAILAPFITFAVAAVWYFVARSVRRNRDGIDIDLQYTVIPPE